MKCRTHTSDQSAGVCPFCLRDRLSALAAASSQSNFSDLYNDVKKRRSPNQAKPSNSYIGYLALITGLWKKNKKKSRQISPENGRGMSPAMYDESGEEYACCIATPSRRRAQPQQSPCRLSSYAICLSPMLRPSSGYRRSYAPPDTLFSGDLKRALNRKWSGVGRVAPDGASGLGFSRSRKLVDLGKAW